MSGFDDKPYLRELRLERERVADFEVYPYNIPAVRKLCALELHADVTFFVGENGSGKSTLLEAIALGLGFGPEGGTRNMTLLRSANDISRLHEDLTLVRSHRQPRDFFFLRAESLFNVATYSEQTGYLAGYDDRSLHARSHGEAFLTILNRKLRGCGFYLFDEPEAALSPTRQMTAVASIHRLVEEGSQFIIATHSPILLAYPRSKIFLFGNEGISETTYENTEHYAVTKRFLNHYERMVDELMR